VKDKTRVKTTDQILDVLKEYPHLALIDVANRIGRSVSTVERAVLKLKQEGRLEYQGHKKSGVWVVREVKISGILLKIHQEREQRMSTRKPEKVKSPPFSDFVRYASTSKKQIFFEKIRDLAIEDQRQVIVQAEGLKDKKGK
jgi:hypothetical protein